MTKKDQAKLDSAVAATVYGSRLLEFSDPIAIGEFVTVDVRFGNEGPDSWTRVENVIVEARHITLADQIGAQIDKESGRSAAVVKCPDCGAELIEQPDDTDGCPNPKCFLFCGSDKESTR